MGDPRHGDRHGHSTEDGTANALKAPGLRLRRNLGVDTDISSKSPKMTNGNASLVSIFITARAVLESVLASRAAYLKPFANTTSTLVAPSVT
jgi:hypothetical protein